MIFGSNVITEEILDVRKADDNFIQPLLKPLERLIEGDSWYIQRYSKQLYIFHPMEITKRMDMYKIKCFVLYGVVSVEPVISHLDIGILYTAKEIKDEKMLKELNGELTKAMLTDNLSYKDIR